MGAAPWSIPVRVLPWPDVWVDLEVTVADTPVGEVVLLLAPPGPPVDTPSAGPPAARAHGAARPGAIAALAMVRTTRADALAGLIDDLTGHPDARAGLIAGAAGALERTARPIDALLTGLADDEGRVAVLVAGTPFARAVMAELVDVPCGTTITYGELAERAGAPRAARAVGTVMARTLVPLVVPCHRVVPASGGVGAYGPHPRLKRTLLELEGALA